MTPELLSAALAEIEIKDHRYIAVKEAARKYHYNPDYLGYLCRSKKVQSFQIARNWFVEEDSLQAFLTAPRPHAQMPESSKEARNRSGLFACLRRLLGRYSK